MVTPPAADAVVTFLGEVAGTMRDEFAYAEDQAVSSQAGGRRSRPRVREARNSVVARPARRTL